MKNIIFTVDVEALKHRAINDKVNKLIYGKYNNSYYGINKMIEIGDKYNFKFDFFVDIYIKKQYGEKEFNKLLNFINKKKHNIEIHAHPFNEKNINDAPNLNTYTKEEADIFKNVIIKSKILDYKPIAFRGGGFRFNKNIINCLKELNIKVDTSLCKLYQNKKSKSKWLPNHYKEFRWDNNIIELPVTYLGKEGMFNENRFSNINKVIENIDKCSSNYIIIIFHSWSFFKKKDSQWKIEDCKPDIETIENIEKFVKYIKTNNKYNITTIRDIINKLDKDVNMVIPLKNVIIN